MVGPVANVDTLAFFLVAALPLVGTVRTRLEQPVWRVWACFAVLLVAGVGTQSRAALVAVVGMIVVAVLTGHAGAALRRGAAGRGHDRRGARHRRAAAAHRPGPHRPAALLRHQHRPAQRRAARGVRDDQGQPRGRARVRARSRCSTRTTATTATTTESETSTPPTAPSSRPRPSSACSVSWRCTRCGWCPARPPDDAGSATAPAWPPASLLALVGLLIASLLESEQYVLPLWFMAAMALALGRPEPHPAPAVRRRRGRQVVWTGVGQIVKFAALEADRRKPWPRRWCVLMRKRGGLLPQWGS